jgi:hypothetical protein
MVHGTGSTGCAHFTIFAVIARLIRFRPARPASLRISAFDHPR